MRTLHVLHIAIFMSSKAPKFLVSGFILPPSSLASSSLWLRSFTKRRYRRSEIARWALSDLRFPDAARRPGNDESILIFYVDKRERMIVYIDELNP